MGRNLRWVGFLGAAAALLIAGAADAASKEEKREARALLHCQQVIANAGRAYGDHVTDLLSRCVGPLGLCDAAVFVKRSCSRAVGRCERLSDDLARHEERLADRIDDACRDVPLDGLMADLGYAEQMADCTVDSLDAFVACLAQSLRTAAAEALVQLTPGVCELVRDTGLERLFPESMCKESDGCDGPPPPPPPPAGLLYCGGPNAVACPEGFACDRSDPLCTQADTAGVCVAASDACTDQGNPVCGCDGQTYPDDCDRLAAGAVLKHGGACMAGQACGGSNPPCAAGMFCEYPLGSCGEGQTGTCVPTSDEPCNLCTEFVTGPICGCDLVTYATHCDRKAVGVSAWFEDACPF